jgi:HEAT repeat protein
LTDDRGQAAVQAAVEHLVADPKADPAPVATTLRSTPLDNESRLVSILTSGGPAQQLAAARLLGEIGSSAAVPSLLQASGDLKLRAAAISALSRLADTPTINEIVRRQTDIELQRTLFAGLLGRGDAAALGDYLNYVQSDTTGETALSAAELVQNPPMEMLFGVLQSPSELNRLAAARVIGRIDGPATTQRLIAMVEQGTSRQEACVALLSSRGEEAVNFVTNARANPPLASLLQAASLFVSTNSQPRS